MTIAAIAAIAYGLLSIIGGIVGYTKAGSKPSLISGLVSGIVLIASGILVAQGMAVGLPLAIAVTALLVIVFAVRLSKTRKFMPAGLMLIAGGIALALLIPAMG